ncbi:hypothetical protein [Pseudophaeobacter flagellatus]|nr:hypothetical protein [Pseudophaeobacter flagellatus]MCD9148955.1 hypothetical protein [Pseudophaeobacter flagellatus]
MRRPEGSALSHSADQTAAQRLTAIRVLDALDRSCHSPNEKGQSEDWP